MQADKIIKNAKIFTSDKKNLSATALAVKDGKFVYVGDEAGLANYEGEIIDLGGKFVMPGIIDSHVHVTTGVAFEYVDCGLRFECSGRQGALDFMADYIQKNPGLPRYRFFLEKKFLNGEDLDREDLDSVANGSEIVILEGEAHSTWVNSKVLEAHGITDETPDPVPGISYYVRKDGHLTGNAFEAACWPFLFDSLKNITGEQIEKAVSRWIDYCKEVGVSGVFEAAFPEHAELHEKIYSQLREMDRQGKLPVYIDGSYILNQPRKMKLALEEVRRFSREFNTPHLKVHTLKILMDGTLKIETAALVTPYADTNSKGVTVFSKEQIAEIIKSLNEAGLDLHIHTVGENAARTALDGVELAQQELGESYRVKVTLCHLEILDDADLERFAKLGVTANFTPWWHSGGELSELAPIILGKERAAKMYRCKTIWDTGALVTWSSDNVTYGDFMHWNPLLGMEVGMTRWITDKTNLPAHYINPAEFPPAAEKMNIAEMILGYTINGAKQLGIDAAKGSIEVGKDADFLIFNENLTEIAPEGLSSRKPQEVYFGGKLIHKGE